MNWAECIKLHHGITSLILGTLLFASEHVVAQNSDKVREQSLTPGMSFVLVFFVSVFFLTAFTFLFMRQFSNSRFSLLHSSNPTSPSPSLTRERGLDPAVVNTFPTFLYSEVKGHRIGQRALECAVCILEFEDNEILRLLPKCSHVFHPVCIDPWLDLHVTCPLCRANLIPKPGEKISNMTITFDSDSDCNLTDQQLISLTGAGNGNGAVNGNGNGFGSSSNDLIIDISDITTPALINMPMPNQRRPPRSTPKRLKITGKFRRSHSTGHLFVREVENRERFTLRLPEDVRSQLMKRSPGSSSPVAGVFLSVRSPRKVYRSSSVGNSRYKNYELFDSVGTTSHFLSQASSVRSTGDDYTTSPKSFMTSIKSPLDRLLRGTDKDDGGERSTRRLIPNAQL